MNPVGYVLRRQRGRVRTMAPWGSHSIQPTSRTPRLVHRVNPPGNLAYMVRTMARPKPEYRLSLAEGEQVLKWEEDVRMNRADLTWSSPFLDWEAAVRKYAHAKGFRVEWFWERDPDTKESIFHWKEARR